MYYSRIKVYQITFYKTNYEQTEIKHCSTKSKRNALRIGIFKLLILHDVQLN